MPLGGKDSKCKLPARSVVAENVNTYIPSRKQYKRMSLQAEDEQANMARVQISSPSFRGNADLLSPSPSERVLEDGDSGFHELIDDAAAFELMPVQSPLASHVLSAEGRHTSSTSTGSLLSPFPASPTSGAAGRALADDEGREVAVPVARSASSTGSAVTQPDIGAVEETGREGEGDSGLLSPSPTGSEEDVSGKGELCKMHGSTRLLCAV